MAKLKTGTAIQKWRIKNGKRVREWHACVSYIDESGKRRQWVQKPKDNRTGQSGAASRIRLRRLPQQ
jgi:hypothetical protein